MGTRAKDTQKENERVYFICTNIEKIKLDIIFDLMVSYVVLYTFRTFYIQ